MRGHQAMVMKKGGVSTRRAKSCVWVILFTTAFMNFTWLIHTSIMQRCPTEDTVFFLLVRFVATSGTGNLLFFICHKKITSIPFYERQEIEVFYLIML
jgi:hypothetical protein